MLSEQDDRALRMHRLAAVANASPSRLSHAARQLEARGLLARRPDPDDGRCIRAVLTDRGLAAVEAAAPGHVAVVRELVFDALDAGERMGPAPGHRADPRSDRPRPGHPPVVVGTGGGRAVSTVVTDQPERARYELEVDGGRVGLVTYRMRHGVVELLHTEVDPDHQGEGLAAVLVRAVLDDARARGLPVLPFCPYVARSSTATGTSTSTWSPRSAGRSSASTAEQHGRARRRSDRAGCRSVAVDNWHARPPARPAHRHLPRP